MSQWDDNEDPYNAPYSGDGGGPAAPDPTTTAPRRFKTTPAWQDPLHAPSPSDPYYAEWRAANPGIPESAAEPIGNQVDVYGNPYGVKPHDPTTDGGGGVTPPTTTQTPPDIYHGALTAPYSGTFTPPTPVGSATPPTFTPGTFTAPSVADALNDPGYQFRLDQGRDALQSWAAAKGTLNDSETGKALIDYGQGAGSQEYANVFGRALSAFNTNEADRYQGYGADFAGWQGTQTQNNTNYQNAWSQFLNGQNEYDSWQDRVWNKVFGSATA